jgi:hypothetical protein
MMTVCLPDDLPTSVLAAAHSLDRHLGVPAATCPRFWVNGARRWQHRQLIDLRGGRPAYCAGGPVGLLDLAGMRQAAAVAAGIRYQTWTRVVAGTRPAVGWAEFAARHLTDPHRYPADRAAAEFARQPRVAAIRLHNAASPPTARLDLTELEAFQTGPAGYTTYHALCAAPADALLTADGRQLRPATGNLSDRISYLQAANHHIDTLHPTCRLLAITL